MFAENQQIGLYKLIRKLGKGGFGEVWLAERTSEGFRAFTKKVAVKLPHKEQVDFKAIEQEATLWEQVSGHANVLPIIDADVFDGQVVIVSEYAEGGSLADKLEAEGKFPVRRAVELTIGILKGLEFLHHKKIIHRDIKPHNILLQGDTPRLADFGISRAMQTTTYSSKLVGTDAYMSPEALDGKRTEQTDVWSVGVVLYELLKDDLPFPQEHPSERMFAILTKNFDPLPLEIPYKLRDAINKALAKNPSERYATALAMREDLTAILAEMSHSSHAETKPLPISEIAETKRIIKSGEQVNPTVNTPPIRLKELHEISAEVNQTQPALTQSSFPTEPIGTHSNEFLNPPPTQVIQFANTGKSRWQNNLRFVLYGAAPLLLVSFLAISYVLFSYNSASTGNSATPTNTFANTYKNVPTATNSPVSKENQTLNNEKIRVGKNLQGWISSNNEMTVEFEISGIGESDVIEAVRKDLFVEINGTEAKIDSQVVNGSVIKVRAVITLTIEAVQNFKSSKIQDFLMRVEMTYNQDVVAKVVNTKFQKGKGANPNPSLGDLVVFGDLTEKNITPQNTPKPVLLKATPTPVPRTIVRQQTQSTTTQRTTENPQTKPKTQRKPVDGDSTTSNPTPVTSPTNKVKKPIN
ncbi:hypothetical protein BH10ACI1_BH10ACI1_30420 [soil metagenome]